MVFWCHNSGSRKFGRLRGCPFGAAACVQGCARLPLAMCALLQHHLLVPVQHYQDDHHCVEPSNSVTQAWTLIKQFYGLLGPKLASPGGDKFPLPSQVYRLLGTKVDLTVSPREIQVLPSRVDTICCELKQIFSSRKLSKGRASEIFGKLSFPAGQLFGRFGRVYLVPFKLRQYGKNGCTHITEEIERAITFWLSGCLFCPAALLGLSHSCNLEPFGTGWRAPTPLVPNRPSTFCTRCVVSESTEIEPQRHINKIEAVVPAMCLCTWPDLIRGSLWLHFIDNDGALACLVSGSSKNSSLSAVVYYTWAQIPALGWFERVPSECNIVDGLSGRNFSTAQDNNWVRDSVQLPEPLLGLAPALS